MHRYVIEREIPGFGNSTAAQLRDAATKSCAALAKMATEVQWIESYVTDDKTFCVYLAKDKAAVRKHAEASGFPADRITEVKSMLDATMAA